MDIENRIAALKILFRLRDDILGNTGNHGVFLNPVLLSIRDEIKCLISDIENQIKKNNIDLEMVLRMFGIS